MRVVIVFESSYGNTRQIADAIADGIGPLHDVSVVPVAEATRQLVADADLLVVGGPTHIHGMSRPASRASAATAAGRAGEELALDPDAGEMGVREWLGTIRDGGGWAAAFDTRLDAAALLTGRAATGIAHVLVRAGFQLVTAPMSFRVTKSNQLVAGQLSAARHWGESLPNAVAAESTSTS